MRTVKLIQLYQSPRSERVRWGFAYKKALYEKKQTL